MKEIAALVEVADIIEPKVILDTIETERRKKAVLAGLCKVDRTLVRTKGRSVHIPKRGILRAVQLTEGADITTQGIPDVSYSTVEVTPVKIGTYFKVTQEAIDGTEIDIINDLIKDAGAALGDKEDDMVKDELCAPGNAGTTLSGGSTLTFDVLAQAKVALAGKKYDGNVVIVSPVRAMDLVKDATRFVTVEQIGKQAVIEGAIGMYAGFNVVVSGAMPDKTVVAMDKEAAPWLVLKRERDVKRFEKGATDSIEFYVYREEAVKVTQPDGIVHITFA